MDCLGAFSSILSQSRPPCCLIFDFLTPSTLIWISSTFQGEPHVFPPTSHIIYVYVITTQCTLFRKAALFSQQVFGVCGFLTRIQHPLYTAESIFIGIPGDGAVMAERLKPLPVIRERSMILTSLEIGSEFTKIYLLQTNDGFPSNVW